MSRIILPPGCTASLRESESAPGQWLVVVAPIGVEPHEAARLRPGGMAALLTHDPFTTWPDAIGRALARAALTAGIPVVLQFHTRGDAETCQARLEHHEH